MKHIRRMAILAWVAMLAGVLSGCGKKDTGGSVTTEQQKGRFVEIREELPQELEAWKPQQIFSVDGKIHLLASKNEDDKTVFSEWGLEESGFTDMTQSWLTSLELPCGEGMNFTLAQGGNGTQYLLATYGVEGEDSYSSHLWKGESEGGV